MELQSTRRADAGGRCGHGKIFTAVLQNHVVRMPLAKQLAEASGGTLDQNIADTSMTYMTVTQFDDMQRQT